MDDTLSLSALLANCADSKPKPKPSPEPAEGKKLKSCDTMMSDYVPQDFGLVMLVLVLSWLLNAYLSLLVTRARKKYNVPYPTMYADSSNKYAYQFNCIQRAHQNTLELLYGVQLLLVVNGLFVPRASALLGFLWVVMRFVYGWGYAHKGPKARLPGAYASLAGLVPLVALTFLNGISMISFLDGVF